MIGKPEWFTYRKFGWGIQPKTKEGWIYIGVILAIIGLNSLIPIYNPNLINLFYTILTITLLTIVLDTFHIMAQLGKTHDERQNYHQLIIERNVSFAGIGAIVLIILYQGIQYSINVSSGNIPKSMLPFDWEIGAILAVMVLTKGISSIYVEKKL